MSKRVVSLLPAGTEMVCALGAQDQLVGRSHECNYPEGVVNLPYCTSPRVDLNGTSRETDDKVMDLIRKGSAVYEVDPSELEKMKPDVIITQSHCEVCAVDTNAVHHAIREGLDPRPSIVDLQAKDFPGILEDIKKVGEALGRKEESRSLVKGILGTEDDIKKKVKGRVPKSVAAIEWIDPLMAGGNWVPRMVSSAGGRAAFGITGAHSPWIGKEALLAEDPELILIMPCGYSIEKTRKELAPLLEWDSWEDLSAVKTGEVYLLDGDHYFNRPGPRIKDSLRILAEVIHPKVFSPSFHGSGWVKLYPEP